MAEPATERPKITAGDVVNLGKPVPASPPEQPSAPWGKAGPETVRDRLTASKIRDGLRSLQEKAAGTVRHASAIASSLDGSAPVDAPTIPDLAAEHPLLNQLAAQVLNASQTLDALEAQLKRLDEILA